MMTGFFLIFAFGFAVIATRISITVAVAIPVTIAIILATISIALFGLDTIDDDGEVHATIFKVFDETTKCVLVGHALTDDEEVGIGMTHEQQGIG